MSQAEFRSPISGRIGYVLKQAAAALRAEMDSALQQQGLTVPQYACLRLLGESPGLSNAELARGAFVTRQSMNLVLRRLQEAGLVARPDEVEHGRSRPSRLTAAGRAQLETAERAVEEIEGRMFAPLSPGERSLLRANLATCATAVATDRI